MEGSGAITGIYGTRKKQSYKGAEHFPGVCSFIDIFTGIKFVFSVEVATARCFILLFISLVKASEFYTFLRIIQMNIPVILTVLSKRRCR
jgi:hypothetical protein